MCQTLSDRFAARKVPAMEDRDLASNLEFWSGRTRNGGAGEQRQRPLPSFRRRQWRLPSLRGRVPRGRARPMAAAALLAALAAGWLVAGHRSHAEAEVGELVPPAVSSAVSASPTSAAARTTTSTSTVPRTDDCRGLSPARRAVRCVVDGIDLDVRLYSLGTVAPAYRRATGADGLARSGRPACARGVPDERAWSLATFPEAAVGRYQCRFEHGHAAMWWTRRDRLFHAVAPDADLAGLFSWWRAHPSE
jgi:hypothetical protein